MNIEVKVSYSVFFYNQILFVVPLYDLSSHELFLSPSLTYFLLFLKRKNIYYFCSHISVVDFHSRKNKGEGNYLLYHMIAEY